MLIAFQVIVMILLLVVGLVLIGDQVKENKVHYSAFMIAGLFALCFTFWIG
jgi:hypothetical protein